MLIFLTCHLNALGFENTACCQNCGGCIGVPAYGLHKEGECARCTNRRTQCPIRALIENGNKSEAGSFQAAHRRQSAFEAICLLERDTQRESV